MAEPWSEPWARAIDACWVRDRTGELRSCVKTLRKRKARGAAAGMGALAAAARRDIFMQKVRSTPFLAAVRGVHAGLAQMGRELASLDELIRKPNDMGAHDAQVAQLATRLKLALSQLQQRLEAIEQARQAARGRRQQQNHTALIVASLKTTHMGHTKAFQESLKLHQERVAARAKRRAQFSARNTMGGAFAAASAALGPMAGGPMGGMGGMGGGMF